MNTLELKGLDGCNPLGMLAAFGAFRVATLSDPSTLMGWRTGVGVPYPYIETSQDRQGFAEAVCCEARRVAVSVAGYADIIKTPAASYRNAARTALADRPLPPGTLSDADYFAAFACDAIIEKDGMVKPTLLSFSNRGSMQFLLKDFRSLAQRCKPETVIGNILEQSRILEPCTSLNWDPASLRSHALRWNDPNTDAKQTDVPLNVLGFMGLAAFPSMPSGRGLATAGFGSTLDTWSWPIWDAALTYQAARSLLTFASFRRAGIQDTLACRRFSDNKRLYFAPAVQSQ